MLTATAFQPGDLVRARGREWVVLPETRDDLLKLRPLGGAEDDATLIYLPLEPEPPEPATFELPDPDAPGSHDAALLLRDALRLKLRAGAGPFRSFGNLNVEPRAYQLVTLLMALKLDTVRLLVADDVGIGKTIEAALIARELLDRGDIERLAIICPPHLCEQWQRELAEKFSIDAEVVRTGTATRLERGLRPDESVFEVYPFTMVRPFHGTMTAVSWPDAKSMQPFFICMGWITVTWTTSWKHFPSSSEMTKAVTVSFVPSM